MEFQLQLNVENMRMNFVFLVSSSLSLYFFSGSIFLVINIIQSVPECCFEGLKQQQGMNNECIIVMSDPSRVYICISNHHKSNIADSLLTDVIPKYPGRSTQVRVDKSGSGTECRVKVADMSFYLEDAWKTSKMSFCYLCVTEL